MLVARVNCREQMVGEMGRLDLRIEKELATLGGLGIVGGGGRVALGEIFAPFLVLLAQFLELLVPILGIGLGLRLVGRFLQHRVDLDLLLDERLQLHRGRLQELQRLLHLGRERLPERKILM